jgi:hypothetical protein
MRPYGSLNPLDNISLPPDTVNTLLMTGGSSAQAMDWPSTLSQIVRFTGLTTGGAQFNFMVNLISTHANVPTSGSSVTTGTSAGSTGNSMPVFGAREFQIPSFSTGFSIAALTSGYVMAEIWRK